MRRRTRCASDSGLLEIAAVERALGPRTRAVLAVHLYGHPVALGPLAALCRDRQVMLLEDAAQAHGARWADRPVGSFGVATALSFHPSKNLGAFGDGGAVLFDFGGVLLSNRSMAFAPTSAPTDRILISGIVGRARALEILL